MQASIGHSPHHLIVIGNPINHSKSPDIHHAFARQAGQAICYRRLLCPDDYDSFVAVVQAFFYGGGVGANVTLPFKEMAYQLCDTAGELSDEARLAGAVNTLAMADGQLFGDNTDGKGLVYDLNGLLANHQLGDLAGKSVLLLGAGGASRGVILPLLKAGVAQIAIANRTHQRAVQLTEHFASHADKLSAMAWDEMVAMPSSFDIVINATSATTMGQNLALPTLTVKLAYDMAYGRSSHFLTHFAKQGAVVSDGVGMLIAQAAFSFERWTGVSADKLDLLSIKQALS